MAAVSTVGTGAGGSFKALHADIKIIANKDKIMTERFAFIFVGSFTY
jgi:hypothetical protein